jgi:hypothetical protein
LDLPGKRLMKSHHVNGSVSDALIGSPDGFQSCLCRKRNRHNPARFHWDDGSCRWLKIPGYRPQVSPLITACFGNVGVIEHALWLDPGALANESSLEFR